MKETLRRLLYTAPCERKQLRGLMYARYVAEHMPQGIDEDIRNFAIAIAVGQPEPKLNSKKEIYGPSCLWPSPRWPIESAAFWIYQERIANGRLTVDLRR